MRNGSVPDASHARGPPGSRPHTRASLQSREVQVAAGLGPGAAQCRALTGRHPMARRAWCTLGKVLLLGKMRLGRGWGWTGPCPTSAGRGCSCPVPTSVPRPAAHAVRWASPCPGLLTPRMPPVPGEVKPLEPESPRGPVRSRGSPWEGGRGGTRGCPATGVEVERAPPAQEGGSPE